MKRKWLEIGSLRETQLSLEHKQVKLSWFKELKRFSKVFLVNAEETTVWKWY